MLRNVAIMAQPFMPVAAGKLLDLVGVVARRARLRAAWARARAIPGGLALPAPSPIFPRYVEAEEGDKPKA